MNNPEKQTLDLGAELDNMYKRWPEVKRFLKSKGCKVADAEDIFQEALLIYTRKLNEPEFKLTTEPFNYVMNTCKFIWYNQSRKEKKHRYTELHENVSQEEEEWIVRELKLSKIENALSQIGERCQKLLQLLYDYGLSMSEIAERVGLRNGNAAKVQKFRCIQKVKDIVMKTPEDFDIHH
ncbi:sigma-70 family RNA polymerase sigma factor [Crocinitomicaceae bacterium]|nr:sigma-70 family RNA polymerase sigma factor [Crocinitomicaceae bacterium]